MDRQTIEADTSRFHQRRREVIACLSCDGSLRDDTTGQRPEPPCPAGCGIEFWTKCMLVLDSPMVHRIYMCWVLHLRSPARMKVGNTLGADGQRVHADYWIWTRKVPPPSTLRVEVE